MKKRLSVTAAALLVPLALVLGSLPAAAVTGDPTPVPTPSPATSTAASPQPTPTVTPTGSASPSPLPTPAPSPSPSLEVEPTPAPAPVPVPQERVDGPAAPRLSITAATVPLPNTSRISTGSDAYSAAVAASKALFPSGADTVVITSGPYPIFAAVGASVAAESGAALLTVGVSSVPSIVLAELRRLAPSRIIVAGGPVYVGDSVIATLRGVTPQVSRVGGATLYETARKAFQASAAPADTVYIAGARTTDDAPLAAVAAAVGGKRSMVVSGHGLALDAATVDALRAAGTKKIVVVQSTSPLMASYIAALRNAGFSVSIIGSADRFATAALVARATPAGRTANVIVNPSRPFDGAVAAGFAAVVRQPLYYAMPECMPDTAASDIKAAGGRRILVGVTAALGSNVVASLTTCSSVKASRQAALTSAVRATAAKYSGTFSVTVRQLGGLYEVAQVGGGTRREAASMMKIFAAWAAYKRVEQGKASLTTRLPSGVPLETCIKVMIHVSDNYCHTDIVHWIGISTINSMIRGAGFTNTYYGNVPRGTSVLYAGNRSTTNDMAWMMHRLANRTILAKAYSDRLINHMRSQIWKSRIASGIPPGVPQASKPGSLWIASGLLQADTAIVNGPKYTYAISIIGDNGPSKAALRAISRTVYTHFNGSFGTAASYPVKQMVTTKPVGLRSSPAGTIVTTIGGGTAIEVLDANREWYQVVWGTRKLWVYYTGLRNR
ncbi:serine hydrolase [Microbacterium sulfonylureivorans]|uniref:serine hydrolase n=1 Tax=Microbacterium sulfonylureivorans TaxID=2486854 RepID=UPI0013DFF767|nr:serine hydrolase [Microbacterium sulfonylureivorans]